MTKKRKAILFFTGFAIAIVAYLCFWRDKRDVRYEVIYPLGSNVSSNDQVILSDSGAIIGSTPVDQANAFFIWEQHTGIKKIKRPEFDQDGASYWVPLDVNVHNHIIGCYRTSTALRAFLWTAEEGFILLKDFKGGWDCIVRAINDNGMIIGTAKSLYGNQHAFVWEGGKGLTDLTPDAKESIAYAINNKGQVAGTIKISDNTLQIFLWTKTEGMTTFNKNEPYGFLTINDLGQIAGSFYDSNWNSDLFVWDKINGTKILNFNEFSIPILNNSGQIVLTDQSRGFSIGKYNITRSRYKPYIGSADSGFVSLYMLLPDDEGMDNVFILDMNDHGDILIRDGLDRLALLRPIEKTE